MELAIDFHYGGEVFSVTKSWPADQYKCHWELGE